MAQDQRITSLDFIRGTAVLAMLVANVPWHVGSSMSRVLDPDGTSVTAWLLQYLIFDQRFMPLFAMLFGASIYMLGKTPTLTNEFKAYYIKRMALLLCIGVAHAYLIWPGDILITYALCGPLLLLFYNRSIKTLVISGIILKSIGLAFGEWPSLYANSLEYLLFSWWVDYGEAPVAITDAYQGSYTDLLAYNAWANQFIQWTAMPNFRIWNALGFMLIGMALFKLGILQGDKPKAFYAKMIKLACLIGLPLVIYGVFARIGINSSVGPYIGFTDVLPLKNITFRTGCAVLSFAVLGFLHLIYPRVKNAVKSALEAVGRMALTNYIMQSALFLLLMHSFTVYQFDTLDHDTMLTLAIYVWAIQITFSKLWLARFKQGPIEAGWRKLANK